MNRNEKYMQLCRVASKIFSTCVRRQYACILIDDHDSIVGMGYNGVPSGFVHCVDGGCPRGLNAEANHGKDYGNCFSIHAEQNALIRSDYTARAKKLYVNGPPCFECAKLIANTSIKEVYYLSDESYTDAGKVLEFLAKAGKEMVCLGDVNASQ